MQRAVLPPLPLLVKRQGGSCPPAPPRSGTTEWNKIWEKWLVITRPYILFWWNLCSTFFNERSNFWSFFKVFTDLLVYFWKISPLLKINVLKDTLNDFEFIAVQKTVSDEVLKTWYFPYSALALPRFDYATAVKCVNAKIDSTLLRMKALIVPSSMNRIHKVIWCLFGLVSTLCVLHQLLSNYSTSNCLYSRGGVLEDVVGLEDTFWSSWPWPQVLKNCFVLGLRTALFFKWLKFNRSAENFFWRPFFLRALAFVFFVLGLEHFCPWPRECLSSEGLSLA